MNEKEITKRFRIVRHYFEEICTPLQTKDYIVQLITETNSLKWHLAHTTWLFETFVLQAFLRNYRPLHPHYGCLFNSYYNHTDHKRKQEMALCK